MFNWQDEDDVPHPAYVLVVRLASVCAHAITHTLTRTAPDQTRKTERQALWSVRVGHTGH
eukprot:scaffold18488_cov59-Cyclotella_meneghiniana.AAC.7